MQVPNVGGSRHQKSLSDVTFVLGKPSSEPVDDHLYNGPLSRGTAYPYVHISLNNMSIYAKDGFLICIRDRSQIQNIPAIVDSLFSECKYIYIYDRSQD